MKTKNKTRAIVAGIVGVVGVMGGLAGTVCAAEQAKPADYYNTDELRYQTRPDPTRERFFGVIGTTGLKPRVYPGVVLKVEAMMPGSPSEGKFANGNWGHGNWGRLDNRQMG